MVRYVGCEGFRSADGGGAARGVVGRDGGSGNRVGSARDGSEHNGAVVVAGRAMGLGLRACRAKTAPLREGLVKKGLNMMGWKMSLVGTSRNLKSLGGTQSSP